jgi:predicted transcriptional regulator
VYIATNSLPSVEVINQIRADEAKYRADQLWNITNTDVALSQAPISALNAANAQIQSGFHRRARLLGRGLDRHPRPRREVRADRPDRRDDHRDRGADQLARAERRDEAAHAGEQGRGFAVVAEEVRKLAEEAQSAAQEISQLIGAIQGQTHRAVEIVEDGVRRTQDGAAVVEQTREAFQKIDASVENMTARVEQIAAVSQQIAAGADSMQSHIAEVAAVAQQSSASTEEVSASTEETSASAEQIAASAQELSGNAEALNQLIARFKLEA